MYVVQMEITNIIIELPIPLYYKIIKLQNITMTNIQQVQSNNNNGNNWCSCLK
jgi:hypothetical protein